MYTWEDNLYPINEGVSFIDWRVEIKFSNRNTQKLENIVYKQR